MPITAGGSVFGPWYNEGHTYDETCAKRVEAGLTPPRPAEVGEGVDRGPWRPRSQPQRMQLMQPTAAKIEGDISPHIASAKI